MDCQKAQNIRAFDAEFSLRTRGGGDPGVELSAECSLRTRGDPSVELSAECSLRTRSDPSVEFSR